MCGRFTLTTSPEQLRDTFAWLSVPNEIQPRYNIAPSQAVAVVPNDGKKQLDFYTWGLIPSWVKDPEIGNRLINARSETLSEKPAFRSAFRRKRCLILADGFYEWRQEPGSRRKTPIYIKMKDGKPFAFAGLWEDWQSTEGIEIFSCAIITTEPNELMRSIHTRMPVILPESAYSLWLEPKETNLISLQSLLTPFPSHQMIAYPVSTLVNSPANEDPGCILPIESSEKA